MLDPLLCYHQLVDDIELRLLMTSSTFTLLSHTRLCMKGAGCPTVPMQGRQGLGRPTLCPKAEKRKRFDVIGFMYTYRFMLQGL